MKKEDSLLSIWKRRQLEKEMRNNGASEEQIQALIEESSNFSDKEQPVAKRPVGRPKGSTKEPTDIL